MEKNKRFIKKSETGMGFSGKVFVLVDKETGVNYLYAAFGYGGGLTVLVDKDGKPIVDEI